MNGLFLPDGHAEEQILLDFSEGKLGPEEMLRVAEHLGSCEICAERLAEAFDSGKPSVPPAGFAEEVRRRLPQRETGAELFLYSARVALAACAALFLVFSGTLRTLAGAQNSYLDITAPGFSAVEQISSRLNGFSQQILHWEVFQHAEKKK
ncbi:anti-sigma factor family protein [Caproicibacter sp.]|uniref:anti-sigma factor family protein n=1 Tax=Caproicibacter sp. TaxID=2814884 RepID=UPI0039899AFC